MPMFPIRQSLGGVTNAIQYVIGITPNVFGDTTERDSYATTNPDWLETYDNNENMLVKAGDTFYRRVDGEWEDATFVVGVAGDAEILSNVSPWNYPVKQPNGTFADGELTLNPLTKEVSTPATFRTGVSAGIKLKDTHAISSVGENIAFSNLVSAVPFTVGSWADASFGGEWEGYHRAGGNSFEEVVFQSEFDTTITNPNFLTPATGNRRTFGFYYKGAAAQTDCKIEVFENGKEIFESKLFNIDVGDGFISFEVSQGGSGFVDLNEGTDYQVVFSSVNGDIQLLGNSSGTPYLALKYQEWEDQVVADRTYIDEPPYMNSAITNTFNITTTAITLAFDSVTSSRDVTLSAGEFIVNKAGLYQGQLTVNLDVTLAPVISFWVERYRGGVWSLLDNSLASIRNLTDTTARMQLSTGVPLQAGEKFRIRALRTGLGTVNLLSDIVTTPLGNLTQRPAIVSFRRIGS